ncbi:hypothetical protein C5167_029545 [Papaver somniferum]|nr:hypothetical protein C5167_029545 [Papaver somniferum]
MGVVIQMGQSFVERTVESVCPIVFGWKQMVANHERQVSGKDDTPVCPCLSGEIHSAGMLSFTIRCQFLGCPLHSNISIFLRSHGSADVLSPAGRIMAGIAFWSFWRLHKLMQILPGTWYKTA